MTSTRIASIILDTPDNRRGDIILQNGRLLCDGIDITPRAANMTIREAREAVRLMYGEERVIHPVWGLEMYLRRA